MEKIARIEQRYEILLLKPKQHSLIADFLDVTLAN